MATPLPHSPSPSTLTITLINLCNCMPYSRISQTKNITAANI